MPSVTGKKRTVNRLLVWPQDVSCRIGCLFTKVFDDIPEMAKHLSRRIFKTNMFFLVMPALYFEKIRSDPVYYFIQVKIIFIICDNDDHVKSMKCRFPNICHKFEFSTLDALLCRTRMIDEDTKNDIRFANRSRLHADKLSIVKQLPAYSLFGLPANIPNEFPSDYICPSCESVYTEVYRLQCNHNLCGGCLSIQKSCEICFQPILPGPVLRDDSMQEKIQKLSTNCISCGLHSSLKDYEDHLVKIHPDLATCFIENQLTPRSVRMKLSRNGTCIWKIWNIKNVMRDAISGKPESIYSPEFYIHPKGYKIGFRLYMNGDATGRNTHISLFYVIRRGEFACSSMAI
ncbi:hypothetical protein I4U23_020377 [Adineta vaga]|nr:hypothetical protein I4U23_020377 [Adineta vaga]